VNIYLSAVNNTVTSCHKRHNNVVFNLRPSQPHFELANLSLSTMNANSSKVDTAATKNSITVATKPHDGGAKDKKYEVK